MNGSTGAYLRSPICSVPVVSPPACAAIGRLPHPYASHVVGGTGQVVRVAMTPRSLAPGGPLRCCPERPRARCFNRSYSARCRLLDRITPCRLTRLFRTLAAAAIYAAAMHPDWYHCGTRVPLQQLLRQRAVGAASRSGGSPSFAMPCRRNIAGPDWHQTGAAGRHGRQFCPERCRACGCGSGSTRGVCVAEIRRDQRSGRVSARWNWSRRVSSTAGARWGAYEELVLWFAPCMIAIKYSHTVWDAVLHGECVWRTLFGRVPARFLTHSGREIVQWNRNAKAGFGERRAARTPEIAVCDAGRDFEYATSRATQGATVPSATDWRRFQRKSCPCSPTCRSSSTRTAGSLPDRPRLDALARALDVRRPGRATGPRPSHWHRHLGPCPPCRGGSRPALQHTKVVRNRGFARAPSHLQRFEDRHPVRHAHCPSLPSPPGRRVQPRPTPRCRWLSGGPTPRSPTTTSFVLHPGRLDHHCPAGVAHRYCNAGRRRGARQRARGLVAEYLPQAAIW